MKPLYVPIFRRVGVVLCLRALILCVALAWMSMAFAGKNALYKCVDAAGVTSIQSTACPPGSTQAWRRDTTPEPPPTPEQAAQAEAKLLRDQQTVREQLEIVDRKLKPTAVESVASAPPVTEASTREPAEVDACEAAQAFVGAVREKEWLGLSEEQTRRLYNWVAERCTGSKLSLIHI
jgi:hypothetical protein